MRYCTDASQRFTVIPGNGMSDILYPLLRKEISSSYVKDEKDYIRICYYICLNGRFCLSRKPGCYEPQDEGGKKTFVDECYEVQFFSNLFS